jgi:NAD-dependent deacetylase
MNQDFQKDLQLAADLLRSARHAVAFTGAGISTPSGIPDFRSQGSGLWTHNNPMVVASIETFQRRPERFYDWLRPLLGQIWSAEPNSAHIAMARLEEAGLLKAVITQNIDDLHSRAGSKSVYEVHGSLRTVTCPRCSATYPSQHFRDIVLSAQVPPATEGPADRLPRCPRCQGVVKPDITLFGEMLPAAAWSGAELHCQQADVVLVAGSSLEVWPAAALPQIALDNDAHLILINRTPTPLDRHAIALFHADIMDVLPRLAAMATGQK